MTKRSEYKFLNVLLGTGTGWDGEVGDNFWIYDFEPATGMPFSACDCFNINETEGKFQQTENDGTVVAEWPIIKTLYEATL